MDKKTITTIIIIIILFISIIILNHIYVENDYFEKWLICEYNSKYSNYTETLRFNYVKGVLYEYERDEYLGATKDDSLDEIYDFFVSEKDKYTEMLNDDFKYNVGIVDDKVHIYTYIKTLKNVDFYNSYIKEKEITFDSKIEDIQKKLSDEYSCHIEKK